MYAPRETAVHTLYFEVLHMGQDMPNYSTELRDKTAKLDIVL